MSKKPKKQTTKLAKRDVAVDILEALKELDLRVRESAAAHQGLLTLAAQFKGLALAVEELRGICAQVQTAHDRLENVHRDHMGIMLDVQRQQQMRATLEERARQQGYLDAMGYERNAAWGMARLESGLCPGLSKNVTRCTLKAKHSGVCKFPIDDKDSMAAKAQKQIGGGPVWNYR